MTRGYYALRKKKKKNYADLGNVCAGTERIWSWDGFEGAWAILNLTMARLMRLTPAYVRIRRQILTSIFPAANMTNTATRIKRDGFCPAREVQSSYSFTIAAFVQRFVSLFFVWIDAKRTCTETDSKTLGEFLKEKRANFKPRRFAFRSRARARFLLPVLRDARTTIPASTRSIRPT